jgi:hypothetical protein
VRARSVVCRSPCQFAGRRCVGAAAYQVCGCHSRARLRAFRFLRSCWAGKGLWAYQEGQMGQKLVCFAGLSGTRSRQDASIEVHEAGRIRPSSGGNGGHVLSLYPLIWRSLLVREWAPQALGRAPERAPADARRSLVKSPKRAFRRLDPKWDGGGPGWARGGSGGPGVASNLSLTICSFD